MKNPFTREVDRAYAALRELSPEIADATLVLIRAVSAESRFGSACTCRPGYYDANRYWHAPVQCSVCVDAERCGCIETYPQLIPGRLSHGPGCLVSRRSENGS